MSNRLDRDPATDAIPTGHALDRDPATGEIASGRVLAAPTDGDGRAVALVPTVIEPTPARHSRLLDYLPAIFSSDDFAGRFLCIFEDVLETIERPTRDQPYYFDPATAPPALLDWLAEWLALREGADWPEAPRRRLLGRAVPIYAARGTPQALRLHLTALDPQATAFIQENTDGFRLGLDAALGYNTMLGGDYPRTLTVTLVDPGPLVAADPDLVYDLLISDQPLGTRPRVRLVPR